ncbi:MAG: hypothetical protein GY940_36590, partial [bacterium]|nr:hypothetical protein [bacterium]
PLGKKFVGQKLVVDKVKKSVDFAILLYNEQVKPEKEFYRFKHPFIGNKRVNPVNLRGCSYRIYDNKLFFDDEEGNINVFDVSGKRLYRIPIDRSKEKITQNHKLCYLNQWKFSLLNVEYTRFKDRATFPDYFPPLRDFQIADGKIYAVTYKERDGQNEMIIFSPRGKLIKKTFVPLVNTDMLVPQLYNYYTVKKDMLYRLVENTDSEEWELHVTPIR